MPSDTTRDRLLDAAERLFAAHGYTGVSLRRITVEAGVNVAAIHYHFGAKDRLLTAVFLRRAIGLNRERRRRHARARPDAAPRPASLRAVLAALVTPPIRWARQGADGHRIYMQFMARARSDAHPEMRALIDRDVGHLQRFLPALAEAMPGLCHADLCWRLFHALGVMHYTIGELDRLPHISAGACAIADTDQVVERVLAFAEAGFRAPAIPHHPNHPESEEPAHA